MLPNHKDAFEQLVAANKDVATSMHAMYILRRLRSMGILAEFVQVEGSFSHLYIPANDKSTLIMRTAAMNDNGVVSNLPLMEWVEYPEPFRSQMKELGKATGYYRYQAHFTLIVDDYDPDFPDRQSIADEDGPADLADFTFGASDFQQFVYGAIFHIKDETGFEVYPAMRRSRVAL